MHGYAHPPALDRLSLYACTDFLFIHEKNFKLCCSEPFEESLYSVVLHGFYLNTHVSCKLYIIQAYI